MKKKIARKIVHIVADTRKQFFGYVREFAEGKKNLDILEIGSGYQVKGEDYYSVKSIFSDQNNFTQSDINPKFGHKVIDVTKLKEKDKYDVVVCMYVLEHVYDFQKAIDNMHRALKKGGTLIIAIPAFYPLHDEPIDFWRFTEHAMRIMFEDFKEMRHERKGVREFPYCYYGEYKKK